MIPPRISLAHLPTPLLRLSRMSADLGGADLGGADLWMKRDDLSGVEFSGNKIRKLEFIAAAALADGCDTLLTEGTPQSNHCRATAATCARLGLGCILLLRPPAEGVPQGNLLLDRLFGAQTRSLTRAELNARRPQIIAELLAELRATGRKGRWIPMGASEPLGCWGYITAMAELADQLAAAGVTTCDVVMPISSCGTYAGAVLGGLLRPEQNWRIWAVPVSDDVPYHTRETLALAERAIAAFELSVRVSERDLHFIDGYVGEGYAIPYHAALTALRDLAATEGILLDPVYTAKAFCALTDGIRAGHFGRQRPVIFIHTGGVFSNFAWPELLLPPA